MASKHICLLVASVAALSSCTPIEEVHRQELIGKWRSQSMAAHIHSGNGTNHDFDLEVHPDEWVKQLRHLPIDTEYRTDGTFQSDYRKADGSHLQTLEGDWTFKGDTLFLIYSKPKYDRRVLHFALDGDKATLHGYVDFDGDKAIDDEYREVIQRTGAAN